MVFKLCEGRNYILVNCFIPILCLPQCIVVFSLMFIGRKEVGLEGEAGREGEG